MLVDVQPFFFHTCRNTQSVYDVQALEYHETHCGCPATDDCRTEHLCQQEVHTSAVEKPFFRGKQSSQDRTEASSDTMYGRGTDRIVDF